MKQVYVWALATALATSCRKEDTPPPVDQPKMIYTDLQNRELKFQQAASIDLNHDELADIGFATWFIGDPIEQEDETLFFASSYEHSNVLINEANTAHPFNQGDTIPLNDPPGYNWYPVMQVEMALKNTPTIGQPYWEGAWKQVSHKYLAVQVVVANKRYNGWVELSFDTAGEKLILHKAAISTIAEKAVIAGK
jgi:hypothetical protein